MKFVFLLSSYWFILNNVTNVTIAGKDHQLNTPNITVECQGFEPDSYTIDPVTFDVTVNFQTPQTGKCVLRN